ncbi:MAG: hypothetical protein U0V73_12130 [Acidimicrobiia bacterium]
MDDTTRHLDDLERRIGEIAVRQHGLITRFDARRIGLSDRRIRLRCTRGLWVEVLPGVFRVAGAPATGRQAMLSATLWAGRQSLLSHRAGGVLWGFDGVRANGPEVLVESPRRLAHPLVTVHRTSALPPEDRDVREGIRVTSVARTLVDLAGELTGDSLELALESALRQHLTTTAELRNRLAALGGPGRAGSGALRELLDARKGVPRVSGSAPEIRLRRLLVRAGLPAPVAQFHVHAPGFDAYLDLAYPMAMVAIEYDGVEFHSGRADRARDRAREHRLVELGWTVLRVGHEDLQDGGARLVAAVRSALGGRVLRSVEENRRVASSE